MALFLTAPSQYLNLCMLIINEAQGHLAEGNFTENVLDIIHYKMFGNYTFENTAAPCRGQWVNHSLRCHCYVGVGWDEFTACMVIVFFNISSICHSMTVAFQSELPDLFFDTKWSQRYIGPACYKNISWQDGPMFFLTNCGWVMLTIIQETRLSLVQIMARCLFGTNALFWTDTGLYSIWHLGTNFSEIWFKIKKILSKEIHFKM